MNKDDKNRHCVLLIIDIVGTGRKKWVMSKWQDPVSLMMLQHDDPVLFQNIYEQTGTNSA